MFNRKFIVCASSLCLSLASSSVLAQQDLNAQQNQAPHPVRKQNKTSHTKHYRRHHKDNKTSKTTVKKTVMPAPSSTQEPAVAPISSSTPKPVNLASHFGLGAKSRIKINGFLSAGVSRSNTSAPYNVPGHGSVKNKFGFAPNSLVGLQVTGNITDQLAAVLQLVANGDDTNGNKAYEPKAEWAFLRYQLSPELQFRAGRFRLPAFMYSDTAEVGYTYPWVTLPNEVYRLVPFNNMNGVDMTYSHAFGNSGWVFKVQPYVGENTSKYDVYTNAPKLVPLGTTATFNENDMLGGVVSLSNQYLTLRANYTHLKLSGYIPSLVSTGGQRLSLFDNQTTTFYSLGAKFDYDNFILQGEYAHRSTPKQLTSLTGYYGMLGYRIGKFLPNLTYASIKTTNTNAVVSTLGAELPEDQHTVTLGTAYYINSNLVAKVGVSQITPTDGTNGLFDKATDKKHVYLYSASLDAIF